jgi:hypothetical protein
MLYMLNMDERYTFLRIYRDTLRTLKIVASLQPQNTSLIQMIDRLVNQELNRLNNIESPEIPRTKELPHEPTTETPQKRRTPRSR